MVHLTLSSLILALDDLLTKRLGALESFDAGKAAKPFLSLRKDKIAALPPELRGRPLAEELATTDERHDGFGAVIWFSTEAVLRHPDASTEMVSAAGKLRSTFIPSLDTLKARYTEEASTAKENEPSLATLEAELKMFSAPTGGTLYDVATAFVEAGKNLDLLLSNRADSRARTQATTLRTEVISRLNRLRDDLADAKKDDPTLPADLEEQVFGYIDLLEKNDLAAAEAKKAKKKSSAPGESTTTTPAAPASPPAGDPAAPPAP